MEDNKMYDEHGLLKPEYALTDTEIRERKFVDQSKEYSSPRSESISSKEANIASEERAKKIEENINALKEQSKKYLDSMKDDVFHNKIFYNEFSTYFTHLKMMIDNGLIINYLDYALALSNASVMILTDTEKEAYKENRKELKKLISKAVKTNLNDKKINLKAYFEQMKKIIEINGYISIKQYISFCNSFSLALLAEIDDIDYLEIAKLLDGVKILESKEIQTYDENKKLNEYRQFIKANIKKLEENQKGGIHM